MYQRVSDACFAARPSRPARSDFAVRPRVAASPCAWISYRPDMPADRLDHARRRCPRIALPRRRALVGAARRVVGDGRPERGRRAVARAVRVRTHLGDANRDRLRVRRRSGACAAGGRPAAAVACRLVSRCSGGARDSSRWDAGRAGRRPAAMVVKPLHATQINPLVANLRVVQGGPFFLAGPFT